MKHFLFLLFKVMNTYWKEGKGAGAGQGDKDAEKGGKIFQRNTWEGMLRGAVVEGVPDLYLEMFGA